MHQHTTPAPDGNFSEYRVGLDHVGFGCGDRAELERWTTRLDALGVAHGGIKDASYGSGVSFRDPDGIALEFFAPPSCPRCRAQTSAARGKERIGSQATSGGSSSLNDSSASKIGDALTGHAHFFAAR